MLSYLHCDASCYNPADIIWSAVEVSCAMFYYRTMYPVSTIFSVYCYHRPIHITLFLKVSLFLVLSQGLHNVHHHNHRIMVPLLFMAHIPCISLFNRITAGLRSHVPISIHQIYNRAIVTAQLVSHPFFKVHLMEYMHDFTSLLILKWYHIMYV